MNKTLIATMLSTLIFTSQSYADVTIYGKVNGSLQKLKESTETLGIKNTSKDNWELISNASRIGIKGNHKINNEGLTVIYQAEYEIAIDDGINDKNEFKARNIYLGLQGNLGTIIAGKHDTPAKMAQGKIDMFNDLVYGDIKNILVGENREDNIIMYTSPSAAGFYARIAFMPGEDDGCNALACKNDDDNLADQFSASINYKHKIFWVSLAADSKVQNTDLIRLASQVNMDNLEVGILLQSAEVHDDWNNTLGLSKLSGIPKSFKVKVQKQRAAIISASYKIDKFKIKAQYGSSKSKDFARKDYDATQVAIGVDYALDKNTKLFAYYSILEGDTNLAPGNFDVKYQTLGVGMEYKF